MDEQSVTATVLDSQPGREAPGGHVHLHSEPVPHAQPLQRGAAGRATQHGAAHREQLNQQISETFSEIIKFAHDLGQSIATEFGLTGSDAIALFELEAPMTMKELGQEMGSTPPRTTGWPSWKARTGPARALAARPPEQEHRAHPRGVSQGKDRLLAETMARAPWCTALDTGERRCLLG